jgi:hypothetical protein
MKRLIFTTLIVLVLLQGYGLVDAAEPADYSRIIVMHLNISKGVVTEKSVEMVYGHAPNPGLQFGDFKGMLKTSGGATHREFDIWDTRYQLADMLENSNESSGSLSGHMTYSDTAEITLILPYQEEEMTFELYDKKSGNLLKSVNMSPAISNFQSAYPKEPGGISYSLPPIEAPLVYLVIGIVLFLLLMGMILSMMRKK